MHEVLLYGGATALGSTLSLWAARVRWLRRRRGRAPRLRESVAWGPLPLAGGGTLGSRQLDGKKATVLVFMSNRCPGVKAYLERLRRLSERYGPQGVQFVGVNSIDSDHYPGENFEGMLSASQEWDLPFPYAKDGDQRVAASLGAICTPHVFVLDARHRLRYRGRIDDALVESRAGRTFLADALEDLMAGRRPRVAETAPLGCSIEFSRPAAAPSGFWTVWLPRSARS